MIPNITPYDTAILSLGALFLGIIMLIRGGSWAINASIFVATRFGISPMVIGFTVIAFGTSLPELVVSVFANVQGSPGISLGNVLGSNIANILLVAGGIALCVTLETEKTAMLARDILFMLLATLVLAIMLHNGVISRLAGLAMIAVLAGYLFFQYKTAQTPPPEAQKPDTDAIFPDDRWAYVYLGLGLACIALGAEFLVKGARVSASLIGVPESVIALSIIACGTSLPELSTSLIAARKGQADMVIGNIIGSNVFNILMIVGASALAKPITAGSFSPQILEVDIWIALLAGLCFMTVLFVRGRIGRTAGILFLSAYIAYNIYLYAASLGAS